MRCHGSYNLKHFTLEIYSSVYKKNILVDGRNISIQMTSISCILVRLQNMSQKMPPDINRKHDQDQIRDYKSIRNSCRHCLQYTPRVFCSAEVCK